MNDALWDTECATWGLIMLTTHLIYATKSNTVLSHYKTTQIDDVSFFVHINKLAIKLRTSALERRIGGIMLGYRPVKNRVRL